jgi:hypothetical protein
MMEHYRTWDVFSAVIPARSPDQIRGGIQGCKSSLVALDPGFRRGDGQRDEAKPPERDGAGP